MPYCKYGHYEEWDGLPECINEVLGEHENHETLRSDCPACAEQIDEGMRRYQPADRAMARAEQDEMEADRELMRDEFHR